MLIGSHFLCRVIALLRKKEHFHLTTFRAFKGPATNIHTMFVTTSQAFEPNYAKKPKAIFASEIYVQEAKL